MKNTLRTFPAGAAVLIASCQSAEKENGMKAFPSMQEMLKPFGDKDVQAFRSPDRVHYPETWFHYIGGNVSHEGISLPEEASSRHVRLDLGSVVATCEVKVNGKPMGARMNPPYRGEPVAGLSGPVKIEIIE